MVREFTLIHALHSLGSSSKVFITKEKQNKTLGFMIIINLWYCVHCTESTKWI